MRWKCSVACTALLMGLLAGQATANIIVEPVALPGWVGVGDTFTVEIWADITKDPVLGWGLDLNLTLQSGQFLSLNQSPPVIGPDWTPVFAPDGDELAGLAFDVGIWGQSLLASVDFTVKDCIPDPGQSHCELLLSLSDDNPADLTEGFLLENPPGGFATNVVYLSNTVLIKPEPATVSLLAIAGLALLRRRRR